MIILKSVDELKEYVKTTFESVFDSGKANEIANFIVNNLGDKDIVYKYALESKGSAYDVESFGEVSQAIFQLDDYKQVLKNYIEFLLIAEQFESICNFTSKLFVTNVGTYKYSSVQKSYTLSERYFDRFVEIYKYCEIREEMVMPFFINIVKSNAKSLCYNFKEPLKEYLKVYMQTAHEKLFDYVVKQKTYDCLEYLLEADTNKTLKHLIDSYVEGTLDGVTNLKNYLTKYKQESFNILEPYANSSNEDIAHRAINLIILFKGEWGIDSFLDHIYENTSSVKIRNLISKGLEIDKFVRFKSEKEYKDKVLADTKSVQERLYGLRLKKYYESYGLLDSFEAKSATFIMETFKILSNEMLIKYMRDYFEYASLSTKHTISNIVYDMATRRDKLNGSKWALRLIACFGDEELLGKMFEVVKSWLINLKSSDAEYYLRCMAIYGRPEFIDTIKELSLCKDIDAKKLRKIQKVLKVYADSTNISYDNIEYIMAQDFGLDKEGNRTFDLGRRKLTITLDSDLNVVLTNAQTGKVGRLADDVVYNGVNLKEYTKAIEKEVSKQSKKLYSLFLDHTYMSYNDFNTLILSHNLLKIVAGKVLWGKYKGGRIYETFKVINGEIRHISGNYLSDNDYEVAVCHPLDIADNLELVKSMSGDLLFNQLDFPCFTKDNIGNNAVIVDKFNGLFVNANLFITRLEKLTYKINNLGKDLFYSILAKANERLNMLTVVEFDSVKLNEENNYTTTISSIRLYKLNSLPRDGKNYILSKGENMPLSSIDYRVLSNELALIYKAAENKQ